MRKFRRDWTLNYIWGKAPSSTKKSDIERSGNGHRASKSMTSELEKSFLLCEFALNPFRISLVFFCISSFSSPIKNRLSNLILCNRQPYILFQKCFNSLVLCRKLKQGKIKQILTTPNFFLGLCHAIPPPPHSCVSWKKLHFQLHRDNFLHRAS
jgi:hypothetical protein